MAQSTSILRFLGKKLGFYPKDSREAWKVDSLVDLHHDIEDKYHTMYNEPNLEEGKLA